MSYDKLALERALTLGSGTITTAANLAATAADWVVFNVGHPILLRRIQMFIKTAVTAGNTAPIVTVYSRPTTASSSGQVSLGAITIPNGTAAGSVIYKELDSVRVSAGYDLCLSVTTKAGDSGTAAGDGFIQFVYEADPEAPANQTKMTASA